MDGKFGPDLGDAPLENNACKEEEKEWVLIKNIANTSISSKAVEHCCLIRDHPVGY